jgi:hypothetical protein
MGTCQLRERTLTEKPGLCRIAGGWHRVDNRMQKNDLSGNPKKESQGPHTAVKPMMMMMTMPAARDTKYPGHALIVDFVQLIKGFYFISFPLAATYLYRHWSISVIKSSYRT